ncbi:hypothetical protein BDV06DRAFT_199532 [Aspergillus oleicola]
MRSLRRLVVLAIFVAGSRAQTWQNQINTSMCSWGSLRTAQVQDTVFLDGGSLWWRLGFDTGDFQMDNRGNPDHLIYYLNLSSTFNTQTDNLTALFGSFAKGGGIASNLAPTYVDGTLFSNNNKFYLYGGLLNPTASQDAPPDDTILSYEAHQYGPYLRDWEPQWMSNTLDDGMTRYITNGAGVSAPSENLGFYISGMRAPGWGPIWDNETATNLSQRMITADMAEMRDPVFANVSIPDSVPARANGEAIWLPVADRGIVVLVGGVTQLESIYATGLSEQQGNASERVSPSFMQTVSIYDVGEDEWYNQNTTGDIPPQLTSFCSVYASASDGSSHNIYIYGGYDGLSPRSQPSDDVYVLSIPSFEWIQLYNGDADEDGRKEHKCAKPYPDKMLVLGGSGLSIRNCVDMVRVFNLNTGRFQDTYNPDDWDEYAVPDLVLGRIGGDAGGGATKTSPDSWTTSSLADVFERSYTKTIETYYPYNRTTSNTTTRSVPNDDGGNGFPGWAGAIIGVVLGVLLLVGIFAFWFLRRRKRKGSRRQSETSRGSRVMQWVHAGAFASPGPKEPDTSTTVSGGFTNESTVGASEPAPVTTITAEAAGDPVYEMQGHSTFHPVELPTAYNEENSIFATSPSPTLPVGVGSPISPEIPQEKEGDTPVRPGHHRYVSSLSSAQSYSQSYSPNLGEGDEADRAQRPHYVSGLSEASISSAGTRPGESGFSGSSNRGLGLEDIPDTEDHRTS